MDQRKPRKTLSQIKEYPRPGTIYADLMANPGWPYKNDKTRDKFHARDRALVALLYLGCLRISEALRLTKAQFETQEDHVLVKTIELSKRKPGNVEYREARLPLSGPRSNFTQLILTYLEILKPDERLFPWSLTERTYTVKNHPYRTIQQEVKDRISVQMIGTKRAWHIIHNLLPNWTEHWLRAFGESYLYQEWDHDIVAVANQVGVDARTLQEYLRKEHERYHAV